MVQDYGSRPRAKECSVGGCTTVTATYIGGPGVDPIVISRIFLCDVHEKAWREGDSYLLDPAKIELHLVRGKG